MANNKTSKSAEAYFARYKTQNKQASNRRKKLERLLKSNPNNLQLVSALNDIKYRRCTPKTHVWGKNMIQTAKIMKQFTGKFDKLMFHADPKISEPACKSRNNNMFNSKQATIDKRSMFSMGVRI